MQDNVFVRRVSYILKVSSQPSMIQMSSKITIPTMQFLPIFSCRQMVAIKEVLAKGFPTAHIGYVIHTINLVWIQIKVKYKSI